jgi:LSD1 subclass zinc finger protein
VTLAGHVRCAGTHLQLSAPCATGTHLRVGVQQVRCARCHSVSLFLVAVFCRAPLAHVVQLIGSIGAEPFSDQLLIRLVHAYTFLVS